VRKHSLCLFVSRDLKDVAILMQEMSNGKQDMTRLASEADA
jgi:hypothetical protein